MRNFKRSLRLPLAVQEGISLTSAGCLGTGGNREAHENGYTVTTGPADCKYVDSFESPKFVDHSLRL